MSSAANWREILNARKPLTKLTIAPVDWGGSEPSPQTVRALHLLNIAGVRIIRQASGFVVGIWEDLDSPELRWAIGTVGMQAEPVVYLESREIDTRYKVRSCPDRVSGESFKSWLSRAESEFTRRAGGKR